MGTYNVYYLQFVSLSWLLQKVSWYWLIHMTTSNLQYPFLRIFTSFTLSTLTVCFTITNHLVFKKKCATNFVYSFITLEKKMRQYSDVKNYTPNMKTLMGSGSSPAIPRSTISTSRRRCRRSWNRSSDMPWSKTISLASIRSCPCTPDRPPPLLLKSAPLSDRCLSDERDERQYVTI